MTLLCDTAPLVVAADRRDARGAAIRQLLQAERTTPVVPAPIVAEVDYMMTARVGEHSAREFFRSLAAGAMAVECLEPDEYGLVVELFDRYRGLSPGLADLSLVVLAYRFRTTRILTFDHRHFRAITPLQGGAFTLLPADA